MDAVKKSFRFLSQSRLLAYLVSLIGVIAIMMIIIESPSMLENLDSEYIVPFAAGQMTATVTFVLAEILMVVSVIGIMSSRNRRNGLIGVAATGDSS